MIKKTIRLRGKSSKTTAVIGMVLALSLLIVVASVPMSAVVVNFPDPELINTIPWAIGKPTGDIHDSDLIWLTTLNLSLSGIVNLEGIQHCVALKELDLSCNEIVDITAVSGLTNLTVLGLGDNEIVDISPLSALTNLAWLFLEENDIIDISALVGLTNLTGLSLYENQIVDISTLVDNPGLGAGDSVNLRYNYLDLTPRSPDMLNIEALQDLGVRVLFEPQN